MSLQIALTRRSFTVLSVSAAAAALARKSSAEHHVPPVVVELFTSQGCSSCLAADALLVELSRRPGVIALSLNVDYWDYLGWRDTLGSPECAARQQEYARRRGDGHVYTPQAVVNGKLQMLGSDRDAILDAIARESSVAASDAVSVSVLPRDRELLVDIGGALDDRLSQNATVWVVMVAPRVVVDIRAGENAGRTVTYANVVRKIMPAAMWQGAPTTLTLPKSAILTDRTRACAVLLQIDGTGPIIGAGWVSAGEA